MTRREDVMRAALDEMRKMACLSLTGTLAASWIANQIENALAEVDALPEDDTEDLRPALEQMRKAAEAAYTVGERWKARAEVAEARLAQIAEAASEWNHTGDHYAAYKRIRELSSSEPA